MERYSPQIREKYRKKVIQYIRENPNAGSSEIRRILKIKIYKIFINGIKQAYREAGLEIPIKFQKNNIEEQKRAVLEFIKSNPTCTVVDIITYVGVLPAKRFGSIKEAFKTAEEEYPRRGLSSTANSQIRKRAYNFEKEVINLLRVRGEVKKYVHIGNMILDAILEKDGKRYVVEIKDYRKKPITMHEIKQLYRYIEAVDNCYDGIMITHNNTKRPKGKIYIEGNRISFVTKDQILKGDLA